MYLNYKLGPSLSKVGMKTECILKQLRQRFQVTFLCAQLCPKTVKIIINLLFNQVYENCSTMTLFMGWKGDQSFADDNDKFTKQKEGA